MQKSGGIIALIGGIFGTIAAVLTLMAGGLAGVGDAMLEGMGEESTGTGSMIAGMGGLGLALSFACIIIGAIAMNAKTKKPGIALIISSIIAAITGGTLVAVCMVLVLAGGIMATMGVNKA